jgi:hypothetical protein
MISAVFQPFRSFPHKISENTSTRMSEHAKNIPAPFPLFRSFPQENHRNLQKRIRKRYLLKIFHSIAIKQESKRFI